MKYLLILTFQDRDSRDRCLHVLTSLVKGLCGLRSIACSLREWARKAKIETKEEE